jgi:2-keto-3-deoxy-L-rhamnonate aldolase RhmA
MRTNPVKAALKAGKSVFGSELTRFRSPEVSIVYAAAGFDFVFIDMEHTCFTLETVADMIRVAQSAGIVPLVRVPQAEYARVARVLDCGAQGIIVPRVNTRRQVEEIVSWTRYPPLGIRGFASTPAQTDNEPIAADAFIAAAHEHTLVVIQIERQEALDNLEAMLGGGGVDVACLGLLDLSVDLGIPGRVHHPRMVAAVERIIDVAERTGVATGIISPDLPLVLHWMDRGIRFVSYSSDGLLLQEAATAAVRRLRGEKTEVYGNRTH